MATANEAADGGRALAASSIFNLSFSRRPSTHTHTHTHTPSTTARAATSVNPLSSPTLTSLDAHIHAHTYDHTVAEQAALVKRDALWRAAWAGDVDRVCTLLDESPGRIRERGGAQETLLHTAYLHATSRHKRLARVLIQRAPELVSMTYDSPAYAGESVLHLSIAHNDVDECRFLASCCPQLLLTEAVGTFFAPDKPETYFGAFPLSFAAGMNCAEIVYALVTEFGADIAAADAACGNTAAHICVLHGHIEMYDLLESLWNRGYGRPLRYAETPLGHLCNAAGMSPIVLAASLGKRDFFDHLWSKDREQLWKWGHVTAWALPLDHIDSAGTLIPMEDDDTIETEDALNSEPQTPHSPAVASVAGVMPAEDGGSAVSTPASPPPAVSPSSKRLLRGSPKRHVHRFASQRAVYAGAQRSPLKTAISAVAAVAEPTPLSDEVMGRHRAPSVSDATSPPLSPRARNGIVDAAGRRKSSGAHRSVSVAAVRMISQRQTFAGEPSDCGADEAAKLPLQYVQRAPTALEVVVRNDHETILMSANMLALLDKKWQFFGRYVFLTQLVFILLFLAAFTSMAALRTHMPESRRFLQCPSEFDPALCRGTQASEALIVVFTCLMCALDIRRIVRWGVVEYFQNVKGAGSWNHILSVLLWMSMIISIAVDARHGIASSRVPFSFASIFSWATLLWFLLGFRLTGPFVIVLQHMIVGDMIRFLVLLAIVLLGFTQAFLFLSDFETVTDDSVSASDIAATRFGLILRELFERLVNPSLNDPAADRYILLPTIIYCFLAPIVLLTLLIGMFDNTFSEIINSSEHRWQLERARILLCMEADVPDCLRRWSMMRYWELRNGRPHLMTQDNDTALLASAQRQRSAEDCKLRANALPPRTLASTASFHSNPPLQKPAAHAASPVAAFMDRTRGRAPLTAITGSSGSSEDSVPDAGGDTGTPSDVADITLQPLVEGDEQQEES